MSRFLLLQARRRLLENHDLDDLAAENVLSYLTEEREAVGSLPTDRRIVVELGLSATR